MGGTVSARDSSSGAGRYRGDVLRGCGARRRLQQDQAECGGAEDLADGSASSAPGAPTCPHDGSARRRRTRPMTGATVMNISTLPTTKRVIVRFHSLSSAMSVVASSGRAGSASTATK